MIANSGGVPAANGAPVSNVGTPLLGSMEKPETLLVAKFATYRNLPFGWITTETGVVVVVELVPVEKGDPGICVKIPLLSSMPSTDMVLELDLATYKKCSAGSTAKESGPLPTGNGDPATICNTP